MMVRGHEQPLWCKKYIEVSILQQLHSCLVVNNGNCYLATPQQNVNEVERKTVCLLLPKHLFGQCSLHMDIYYSWYLVSAKNN